MSRSHICVERDDAAKAGDIDILLVLWIMLDGRCHQITCQKT